MLRKQIYALLDPSSDGHAARRVRGLEVLLILIGISSVSAGTLGAFAPGGRAAAAAVTGIVAMLFFVEYLARYWVAPEAPELKSDTEIGSRLRWAVSAEASSICWP